LGSISIKGFKFELALTKPKMYERVAYRIWAVHSIAQVVSPRNKIAV
jgi:hypothetical protein